MVRPAMTGRGAISFFFFCIIPSTIVFRAGITSFRARYVILCALRHSVRTTSFRARHGISDNDRRIYGDCGSEPAMTWSKPAMTW